MGFHGYVLFALVLGEPADPDRPAAMEAVVNRLVALAVDPRSPRSARLEALHILGELGAEAKAAVPALVSQLGASRDMMMLESVVQTLGRIGFDARSALPDLATLAGRDFDLDQAIREATRQILAPPEIRNLQTLRKMTHSSSAAVRLHAAKALGIKGRYAEPAIPDLMQLTRDPDPDVRRVAVDALRKVQSQNLTTETLLQVYTMDLSDPDEAVRLHAVRMLGRMGPAAAPAAKALQNALRDASSDVQRAAAEALNRVVSGTSG